MSLLELPPPLVAYLNSTGQQWPEGDEAAAFGYGQRWMDMGGKVGQATEEGNAATKQVTGENAGKAAEAFTDKVGTKPD
ncbi:hypothetical protein HJ590_08475 [Naumannella sp. ID2617S]|nr:hypothetical protein [Naumannella sp. ID2617S]